MILQKMYLISKIYYSLVIQLMVNILLVRYNIVVIFHLQKFMNQFLKLNKQFNFVTFLQWDLKSEFVIKNNK